MIDDVVTQGIEEGDDLDWKKVLPLEKEFRDSDIVKDIAAFTTSSATTASSTPRASTAKPSGQPRSAGLADLHFHELRYTFATMALANGMSMFDLSRAMGQKTQAVTDNFYGQLHCKDHGALRKRIPEHVAAAAPVAPLRALDIRA